MTATRDARQGMFIHGGALGDLVLSLRAIAAMQAITPRVTLLARSELSRLLVGTAGIEQVVDIETAGLHVLFGESHSPADIPATLLPTHELVVNMLPGGHLSENLRRIGIPQVIDLDPRPRPGDVRHITAQWLAELTPYGMSADTPMPSLLVSRNDLRHARKSLRRLIRDDSRPIGIVHPGSGGQKKCWPHMLELAERIAAERAGVVCLLGPVEAETMPDDVKLAWAERFSIIASSLDSLPPLLAAADFLVGNDSGVSHLAAAVGTHTLTIFGPTDPRVWSPIGPRTAVAAPRMGEAWPSVEAALRTLVELGTDELDPSGPIDIVSP